MENKKPRILLADDEGHIRAFMKAVIKTMGYEVVGEAGNGRDAVERFRELKPDITLLDINMPQKTGTEALQGIIEIEPNACVIMLTSLSDMASIQECITLGASNYIRKDTPLEDIKTMIAEAWHEHIAE